MNVTPTAAAISPKWACVTAAHARCRSTLRKNSHNNPAVMTTTMSVWRRARVGDDVVMTPTLTLGRAGVLAPRS
jgi:hypothetical protein